MNSQLGCEPAALTTQPWLLAMCVWGIKENLTFLLKAPLQSSTLPNPPLPYPLPYHKILSNSSPFPFTFTDTNFTSTRILRSLSDLSCLLSVGLRFLQL